MAAGRTRGHNWRNYADSAIVSAQELAGHNAGWISTAVTQPNNSLDASGGSASRNLLGAAKGALIRAAASTQTLDGYMMVISYGSLATRFHNSTGGRVQAATSWYSTSTISKAIEPDRLICSSMLPDDDAELGHLKMRKVTFHVASSLDNYIARTNGAVDWILGGEEAASGMAEFWKNIDTVVIGRKTYEPVLKSGNPFPTFPGVKNYVLSRTLKESPDKNVEIIHEDVVEFIRKLKTEEGRDIFIMGGGMLAKPLFEANLIDEVGANIHPILLGSGIPLFYEMSRQIDLELIECKSFENGCVSVSYRVKS